MPNSTQVELTVLNNHNSWTKSSKVGYVGISYSVGKYVDTILKWGQRENFKKCVNMYFTIDETS